MGPLKIYGWHNKDKSHNFLSGIMLLFRLDENYINMRVKKLHIYVGFTF